MADNPLRTYVRLQQQMAPTWPLMEPIA